MKPDKETWRLPPDKHGRITELTRQREGGQQTWDLIIHAVSQRYETTYVYGLTTEQLKAIAAIVKEVSP